MNNDKIKNDKKRVTVLLSSFNGEKYISEQLDSILNQHGNFDLKIIVRDDGSEDRTRQILDEYKKDNKLDWYTDGENVGAAKSFMRLLYNAPISDYYAFADQDDVWRENKISESIRVLAGITGYGAVYTNAYLVDSNLNSLNCKVFTDKQKMTVLKSLSSCNAMGCTMIFNDNLVQLIKSRPMPNNIMMHDRFICGVCMSCGGEIVYLDEPTMFYRQHSNNVQGYATDKSILGKVREKIDYVTQKRRVQIDEQAKEIYKYRNYMGKQNLQIVEKIAEYRKNFGNRIRLASDLIRLGISKNGTKHEIFIAVIVLLGKL
ncbi:MAG TPA: hypothetical protein DCS12_07525 [Clostridiales bacterium]|nr:hypothetical protein [Clostridiales bacterium]